MTRQQVYFLLARLRPAPLPELSFNEFDNLRMGTARSLFGTIRTATEPVSTNRRSWLQILPRVQFTRAQGGRDLDGCRRNGYPADFSKNSEA